MSFLLRTSTSRFAAARPAFRAARPFSTSRALALKESDRAQKLNFPALGIQDHPEQSLKNETHKEDSLKKQKSGKGHWKPELASDSEEAVTADRHEHADHSEAGIKELQKKTEKAAEEKHK
ncbi:hypothetical protein BP5796_04072 [Coleophoma crateriformis]|uniref:Mitochondrial carrier protein pet8 protein n=1 Tax=Coleophoma crateriformis TaxID=565419 RepID=A0A3D8SHC2_9HELO|nr:hypothetical protein BP5796_04072 [Coleophoma crateriformis]